MTTVKKFDEYDMRDDFSIPVYVGYELVEYSGIKGINPDNRCAGQLIRENGQTHLELSDIPKKKHYELPSNGIVINNDDEVTNHEDSGNWYASTWNGDLHFVIRKYFRISTSKHRANNHFGGNVSKWVVSDYSIVNQYMLADNVSYATLFMDHVYSWFGIFQPERELTDENELIFTNLVFDDQQFSLRVSVNSKEKHELHVFQKTAYISIGIEFEEFQTREFTYQLAVTIRNFFQMLIGKSVGISRIILNKDNSIDPDGQRITPKNERENWFLDQSFLPKKEEETLTNFEVSYQEISSDLGTMLTKFLSNSKLQRFVASILTVYQFQTPVDTQIITLVSAIESYYSDAKYSDGTKMKNALNKLKQLGQLVENSDDFFQQDIHVSTTDTDTLFREMVDVRDYIVHGDKEEKYTSEAELVPDLIIFKRIIHKAIVRVMLMKVEENNI